MHNTLTFDVERWDDPGDYPSGAGSGPLPSYDYVTWEGMVIFDKEPTPELLASLVPEGFRVTEWAHEGLRYWPMEVELT